MKKAILSLGFLWASAVAVSAQELPDYPFDALSERGRYVCTEAKIRRGSEFGSKRSALIYDLCVSKRFSPHAMNIIRQSFERMIDTVLERPACLVPSTAHLKIDYLELLRESLETVPFPDDVDLYMHSFVFVSPVSRDDHEFSFGYTNFFRNPTLPGRVVSNRRYLSIALNKNLVGATDHFLGGDLDFWAGMSALAILQNFGFSTDSIGNAKSLDASRIGACIAARGRRQQGENP